MMDDQLRRVRNVTYPSPIFDEFLQAFLITNHDTSFYVDLSGNVSKTFRKITWTIKVLKLELASPYIIGFLSDSSIEIRNIFSPNRIFFRKEIMEGQFVSTCVSRNLLNRNGLDEFYLIFKSLDGSTGQNDV